MSEPATELRASPRLRTFIGAKMVSRDGALSWGSLIRDLTESGALVEIAHSRMIPKRIYLLSSKHGVAFDAEVVWRNGTLIGLEFHNVLDLSHCDDPGLLFLKKLLLELRPR